VLDQAVGRAPGPAAAAATRALGLAVAVEKHPELVAAVVVER
jgi:hypothetical protein